MLTSLDFKSISSRRIIAIHHQDMISLQKDAATSIEPDLSR